MQILEYLQEISVFALFHHVRNLDFAETMVWEVGFRFWLFGDFDDFLQLT